MADERQDCTPDFHRFALPFDAKPGDKIVIYCKCAKYHMDVVGTPGGILIIPEGYGK